MPQLIDANVTGRTDSDSSEPRRMPEEVAYHLEHSKRALFVNIASMSFSPTSVLPPNVHLESAGIWEGITSGHEQSEVSEALADAWASLGKGSWFLAETVDRLTRATMPTSTTVSSVAKLLRRHHGDECLRRMPPEARATYDRIRSLREEIGPLDFDIVKALRELRGDE